jgi:hypothetical protein
MTIPLSKAKEVCTSSEYALVNASRAPKLNKLSPEQSRRLAGRARRALVKWRDLSRAQGRARAGTGGERARLKVELFRDALRRFEDKAVSRPAGGGSAAGGKQAGPSKRARAVAHRKARAAVRENLAGATAAWGARAKAGGSGAGRKAAVRKTKARPGTPAASAKKHRPPLKWVDVLGGAKFPGSPDKQRATRPRAKEFRGGEVGMTTRVREHAAAAGKRAQARRDRKGSQAGW